MIFVTVGTQLAFDRLIVAVDEWAGGSPDRAVFAQIGPSELRPRHIEYAKFVSPQECGQRMLAADAIVAHAGMGTILTAMEMGKPLLVMPRRVTLKEHRNDHQLATAHRFAQLGRLKVAFDEGELPLRLHELLHAEAEPRIGSYAPAEFLARLRAFIVGEPLASVPPASSPRAEPEATRSLV